MGENEQELQRYADIIGLPHAVSRKHPHMSSHDRAAQFSPFAALTGYESAIQETARLTDQRVELDETEKSAIDGMLRLALEQPQQLTMLEITYFQPDEKKSGGAYVTVRGQIKKIDPHQRMVILTSGVRIPVLDIFSVTEAE